LRPRLTLSSASVNLCDPDGKQALLVQGLGTLGRGPRPPLVQSHSQTAVSSVRLLWLRQRVASQSSGRREWSGLGLAASWEARNGVCRWPGNLFRQGFQRQSGACTALRSLNSVVRLESEHSPTPPHSSSSLVPDKQILLLFFPPATTLTLFSAVLSSELCSLAINYEPPRYDTSHLR
jgi:hypothetical protein